MKQWFTSRTVCELHIIRGTFGLSRFENEEYSSCFASCLSLVRKYLCSSPIVRLVNHCFTTCTGRVSRVKPFTGRICSTVLDKDGGGFVQRVVIGLLNLKWPALISILEGFF